MPLRYGFLSTYPPTQCGLATFTAALSEQLTDEVPGATSGVVRLLDSPAGPGPATRSPTAPTGVVGDLVAGTRGGPDRAARMLSSFDIVVVQHEYGVHGGRDGDAMLDRLDVPVVAARRVGIF